MISPAIACVYFSRNPNLIFTNPLEMIITTVVIVTTVVIPNAIDMKMFSTKQKQSKEIEELEKPIFLSTSAFVRYKRNDTIIRAVAKLDHGSLVMASDGELRNKTVSLGEQLLGSRFKYVGVIRSLKEIIRLYHACDVFVNASRKEAFGVVFLEAMASNKPVVTQDDQRRRTIIGGAGILIDCKNIQQFAEALEHAAQREWGNTPRMQAQNTSAYRVLGIRSSATSRSTTTRESRR